ncbi:uncharacterized protein [Rutidosis leptorrhynchoides]|uniref:uncharacterized protein isoform X2 n=1 Tax=Rutidosis leptorrhynchoides TaxID=125765 RepID=UPI003A998B94
MATTPTPIFVATIPFHTKLRPPLSHSFILKCSSHPLNNNNNGGLNNGLLNREQNRAVVNELDNKAAQTVELVNKDNIMQETEAMKMMETINQLESKVSEFAEVQKQQSEAKNINKNKEKLESVKAAIVSAIVGTLASLPVSLTHFTDSYGLTVSTAITVISCVLYGAIYRYIIRRDLDDFHLKTGTAAAFGIVKGMATLDGRSSLGHEDGSFLSHGLSGAVCVSENVIVFLLAAAGLDICYKMGILSPFPLESSVSTTKL